MCTGTMSHTWIMNISGRYQRTQKNDEDNEYQRQYLPWSEHSGSSSVLEYIRSLLFCFFNDNIAASGNSLYVSLVAKPHLAPSTMSWRTLPRQTETAKDPLILFVGLSTVTRSGHLTQPFEQIIHQKVDKLAGILGDTTDVRFCLLLSSQSG